MIKAKLSILGLGLIAGFNLINVSYFAYNASTSSVKIVSPDNSIKYSEYLPIEYSENTKKHSLVMSASKALSNTHENKHMQTALQFSQTHILNQASLWVDSKNQIQLRINNASKEKEITSAFFDAVTEVDNMIDYPSNILKSGTFKQFIRNNTHLNAMQQLLLFSQLSANFDSEMLVKLSNQKIIHFKPYLSSYKNSSKSMLLQNINNIEPTLNSINYVITTGNNETYVVSYKAMTSLARLLSNYNPLLEIYAQQSKAPKNTDGSTNFRVSAGLINF